MSNKCTDANEEAREIVRKFIHAGSDKEIIFTRGTTESINLVAFSFGEAFIREGDEILVTEMEHHANIVPWGFIGGVAGTILSYIISFGMNNMTMIVYGLNTLLMKLGINATIDLSSLMGSSDSMYYGGGMYMSDSGSGTVMSIIPIWLVLAAIGFAVVVGLLSGIVPASRAVRISALEAIRHD